MMVLHSRGALPFFPVSIKTSGRHDFSQSEIMGCFTQIHYEYFAATHPILA